MGICWRDSFDNHSARQKMSKKLFKTLIKRASQPVSKEADKQLHPGSSNAKQTRSRTSASAGKKPSGKSRQSNASADPKTPR